MGLSDIEIVDRLLRDAPGAFDLFYRKYERLIYHCIRARADAADVDDIFQIFFRRLAERDYHILRVWQGSSLSIYLSTVIRNIVIDFYRKKPTEEIAVGGDSELETHESDQEETLETDLIRKERRRVVRQAWRRLDDRDKLLVCCKFRLDLTNEAMAERFNLTSGALRTALSRAQGRLLAILRTVAPEYFSP